MREAEKNVSPRSFQERGGGQNLKYKFKTFGFLDTFKVHIQSNYLTDTTLSLLQTELAETNIKLIFYALHSSVSDLKSVIALNSRGVRPPFTGQGGTAPLDPSDYDLVQNNSIYLCIHIYIHVSCIFPEPLDHIFLRQQLRNVELTLKICLSIIKLNVKTYMQYFRV